MPGPGKNEEEAQQVEAQQPAPAAREALLSGDGVPVMIGPWSAVAERSADTALDSSAAAGSDAANATGSSKAVWRFASHRSPRRHVNEVRALQITFKIRLDNYRDTKDYAKIVVVVGKILARQRYVAPIEVFVEMGLLMADEDKERDA